MRVISMPIEALEAVEKDREEALLEREVPGIDDEAASHVIVHVSKALEEWVRVTRTQETPTHAEWGSFRDNSIRLVTVIPGSKGRFTTLVHLDALVEEDNWVEALTEEVNDHLLMGWTLLQAAKSHR